MKAWLVYLVSEPAVVGVLAWLGLIIGIPSLWIAIAQLKKVRVASDAAKDAVLAFKDVVKEHDVAASYQQAVLSLSGALHSLASRNFESSALQLDTAASALVDIREIGDQVRGEQAGSLLLRIRSERELLATLEMGAELVGRSAGSAKRLRFIKSEVEQQLARSRLRYVSGDRNARD